MNFFLIATNFEIEQLLKKADKKSEQLYEVSKNCFIFITGIGKEEVYSSMQTFNKLYSSLATSIINIGIAGALDSNLLKYHYYQIGSLNHENKTYLLGKGKSLVSSTLPIWKENFRYKLYHRGFQIVDMEAFFIYEN